MKKEKKFNPVAHYIQPWSPVLMKSALHPDVVKSFLEITDNLLSDPDRLNYGNALAGQIEEEVFISKEILDKTVVNGSSLYDTLMSYANAYLEKALVQSATFVNADKLKHKNFTSEMVTCWVVSQKENEYNPIHNHTECNLSAVFYLKIPDYKPSRKSKFDSDGRINFIGGDLNFDTDLRKPLFTYSPSPGDIFIFPSELPHSVNPFRVKSGDPERRSISFNVRWNEIEFKEEEK